MRFPERVRRWLLDRWIVHVAMLLWSAPAMYRALLECQTYLGRDRGHDESCRGRIIVCVTEAIWFQRLKWDRGELRRRRDRR